MIFYKTVAAGNDFLHIDVKEYRACAPAAGKGALTERLCRRQTGAGADGVVFYNLSQSAGRVSPAVDFEIFNRDGSEAELSGNGMAGLSALLVYLDKCTDTVTLNTKVGQRTHRLLNREDNRFRMNIEIGPPDFQALEFFPFLEKEKAAYLYGGITFCPVSVGNPHVVVLLDRETADDKLERMGKTLEGAGIFPHKTNVEFVLAAGAGPVDYEKGENFRIFFYERGVGRTPASSTGSAAVFAVLRKRGNIADSLTIKNPPSVSQIKISGKVGICLCLCQYR